MSGRVPASGRGVGGQEQRRGKERARENANIADATSWRGFTFNTTNEASLALKCLSGVFCLEP